MKTFLSAANHQASGSAISKLIDPVAPENFFQDYWDQEMLSISGTAGRFDDILTGDNFCDALFDAKLGDKRLKYIQKTIGNRDASQDFFLRQKATWQDRKSLSELASLLHSGTLVFDSVQNVMPSAKIWCRELFAEFSCQITINAYFSAGPNASAFDAHFDQQDVFILQLEGEKEWRLWERDRVVNPIPGYPETKALTPPYLPADETILLTPGDLLYVPRGTWHWPRSLDDNPSLHLTLTLVMPKPTDIVGWLGQVLGEELDARSSLPFSRYQREEPMDNMSLERAIALLAQKLSSPDAKRLATAYMSFRNMQLIMKSDDASDDEEPGN